MIMDIYGLLGQVSKVFVIAHILNVNYLHSDVSVLISPSGLLYYTVNFSFCCQTLYFLCNFFPVLKNICVAWIPTSTTEIKILGRRFEEMEGKVR